jgi:hypothetical protein
MEERAMMSNIPVFESLNVINGTNPIVQVAPMEQTILHGNFQNGATSDTVQVQLQSGELFTAGLNVVYPIYNSDLGSGLKVTDPRGVQVATESTYVFGGQIATDPISGAATTDTQVAFRAATSGTYTIEVDDIPWLGAFLGSPSYNLSLRPVELDQGSLMPNANAQDAAKLQFSGGGLYSWLDSTQSVLTFSGPTGRGFQIDGQFSETTSPVSGSSFTTSTIVGTGKLVLQSGYGSVALPLPAGLELVVTTQANGYNGLFGEVASAGLQFPYSQTGGELADPVAAYSGNNLVGTINSGLSRLGAQISVPNVSFGIGLGDQVSQIISGAPVDPAIPYLYLSVNVGASASFGQVQASVGGYGGSIVIDPADPSVYVDVQGIPNVPELAVAVSRQGLIPFTPEVAPSRFSGKELYGDLYFKGTLDLASLTLDTVPLYETGVFDVNFDSQQTAYWTSKAQQEASDFITGKLTLQELNDVSVGSNSETGASITLEDALGITIPLAGSTEIINGPASEVDFAASTINPFQNTPLAFLDNQNFSVDGYYNWATSQFDVNLTGTVTVLGYPIANADLDVNSAGVTLTGRIDFLGMNANVDGYFNYDGTFEVLGTIAPAFSVNATLYGTGFTASVSSTLHFGFDNYGNVWVNGKATVSASLWVNYQVVQSYGITVQFLDYGSLSTFSLGQLELDLLNGLGL